MARKYPGLSEPNSDLGTLHYRQELSRTLGLADLLAYGLVFIVPIAPVAAFGIVFNASHGMVPLVYVVGLVAMVFTALSYMTMSAAFPVAGSVYTYATQSMGPAIGFLAGWALLLDYLLIPGLIYVVSAIAIHAAIPAISEPLCVVLMAAAVTVANCFGIKSTVRASFILLACQLAIIALFVVLSIIALERHTGGARFSLAPFYDAKEFGPGLIFGALSLAALSFLGFDAISTLSEESRDGPVAIGRATMLSLLLAAALFVLQTWLACLFVPGRTSLPPGNATYAAFYDIAGKIGGYDFKFLLAVPGILVSQIAEAVTAQAATARLIFGMARDGKLPRALAHIDPVRKTPLRATLLVSVITLVTGVWFLSRLELLTSIVNFGAMVGFLLLHISVIVHFTWRHTSRQRWRHLVAPAIGGVIIAYILFSAASNAKVIGTAWLSCGLVLYLAGKLMRRPA